MSFSGEGIQAQVARYSLRQNFHLTHFTQQFTLAARNHILTAVFHFYQEFKRKFVVLNFICEHLYTKS